MQQEPSAVPGKRVKKKHAMAVVFGMIFLKTMLSEMSLLVALLYYETVLRRGQKLPELDSAGTATSILSGVMGFLLVQWSIQAISRWWEARGHIGRLVHDLHHLGWNLALFAPEEKRHVYLSMLQAYMPLCIRTVQPPTDYLREVWFDKFSAQSLKLHVLPPDLDQELFSCLPSNPRLTLSLWLEAIVKMMVKSGHVNDLKAHEISQTISELHESAMGIEKIGNTPMPPFFRITATIMLLTYSMLILPTAVGYLGYRQMDPEDFAALKGTHRAMIDTSCAVVVFCVVIVFWVLYEIGQQFEKPYGDDPFDLPLVKMAAQLHKDLQLLFSGVDHVPNRLLDRKVVDSSSCGIDAV